MKKTIYASLLLAGGLLISCNSAPKWTDEDEKEFVGSCESSFITGFENTMGENMSLVDRNELDNVAKSYCNCAYNAIKDKYESPEEAFEKSIDDLMVDAADCEPTEEDIQKVLK